MQFNRFFSCYYRKTMNVGAVASMRNVKNAIGVARRVLENTKHTLLAGQGATDFAVMMGFQNESLTTEQSTDLWKQWKSNRCQPNFWTVGMKAIFFYICIKLRFVDLFLKIVFLLFLER